MIFNYNGMAFKNLYQFCKTFILDLRKDALIMTDSKKFKESFEGTFEKNFDLVSAAEKIREYL